MEILPRGVKDRSSQGILNRGWPGLLVRLKTAALTLLLIAAVGWLDYLTRNISLAHLYLIPIFIASWFWNKWAGAIASFLSVIVWQIVNRPWMAFSYSDTVEKLVFFLVAAFLLTKLKNTLEKERIMSRTDQLTGLLNRRSFHEFLWLESKRSQRYGHPITIAYVDMDNFKAVNDTMGHDAGDALLQDIGLMLRIGFRETDIVSRMGGDEFCILLPETGGRQAAGICESMRAKLSEKIRRYPVTISVGIATFLHIPENPEEMIKIADDLMIHVKKNGKNAIRHEIFEIENSMIKFPS